MKLFKYIVLFCCCFISIATFASKKDSTKQSFIAINVSDPLFKIFTKNRVDTSSKSISVPMLYLGRQGKKLIKRFGISGSNSNSITESQLFSDKKTQSMYKFGGIFSLYKFKQLTTKWQVQYGINLAGTISITDEIYDSGFDKVNIYKRNLGGGVGPGILFQYQLSPRIKLFSEYMLIYQYIRGTEGKRFSAFPSENYSNQKTSYLGFQFEYPLAIYLQYHF